MATKTVITDGDLWKWGEYWIRGWMALYFPAIVSARRSAMMKFPLPFIHEDWRRRGGPSGFLSQQGRLEGWMEKGRDGTEIEIIYPFICCYMNGWNNNIKRKTRGNLVLNWGRKVNTDSKNRVLLCRAAITHATKERWWNESDREEAREKGLAKEQGE